MYCPSPTTIEDEIALRESGLEIRRFRFLDQDTGAIDWAGAREDLQVSPYPVTYIIEELLLMSYRKLYRNLWY